jgi:tRNA threonylcarbamoyladenosine biosynthesis protein TsaB
VTPTEPINLLVLDTSTPRAALAVATAFGPVFTAMPDPSERHGRSLVPAIRDLLDRAALAVADLEGFAVGLGPGSYTGLRIGLTAVKTLAYATGKSLVGLDSLEIVARNAPLDALEVAVIADAQRGDVYAADFARDSPGMPLRRVRDTRVVSFANWSAGLSEGALVLGPAAATGRLAEAVPRFARRPDNADAHWPGPLPMAELARGVWLSGRRDNPWFLEPTYIRKSAAEDQWEAKSVRS